jgi:hypothetical protein
MMEATLPTPSSRNRSSAFCSEERVQVNLLGAALGCHSDHGVDVVLVSMNTAIRQQAENMYGFVIGDSSVDGFDVHRIGEEITVADGFVDAGEALVNDAPGAEGHMADFAVTHLAFRQADIQTGGGNEAFGIIGPELVPHRGICRINRVVFGVFRMAKAVEDNQYEGFFGRGHTQSSLLQSRGGGNIQEFADIRLLFHRLLPIGECGIF